MKQLKITLENHGETYTVELPWDSSTPKVVKAMMDILVSSGHSRDAIKELFKDNEPEGPWDWDVV